MIMKKKSCILSIVLTISVFMCFSCTSEGDCLKSSAIEELKDCLIKEHSKLVLPELAETTTKSGNNLSDYENHLVLDWEKAQKKLVEGHEFYEVPIKPSTTLIADIFKVVNGETLHRCSRYSPFLIAEVLDKGYNFFVANIIKDAYSDATYLFADEKYDDFILISDLDGNIKENMFRVQGNSHSCVPKASNLKDLANEHRSPNVVVLGYRIAKHITTKGGGDDSLPDESFWSGVVTCPNCHREYNAFIWNSVCSYCGWELGMSVEYCLYCQFPIDSCKCHSESCPWCGRDKEFCTCNDGDPREEHDKDMCEICGKPLNECGGNCHK